jgi:hypothetical protein
MDASGRLAPELAWLLDLCKSGTAWQEFAKWKANHLAVQEPVTWNELPLLLSNEVRLRKHGPARPSTNQPRRNDVQRP